MKILHISRDDLTTAGTARAMLRLHENLRRAGHDSQVLLRFKERPEADPTIHTWEISRPTWVAQKALRQVTRRLGLHELHAFSAYSLSHHPLVAAADVLHLHCIHENYLSYLALPAITGQRPAVLTLHDMWAFTGGCHYSQDCTRWQTGCGHCPYPHDRRAWLDESHVEWWLKQHTYRESRMEIICPSRWMEKLARESILGELPIHYVPYVFDTAVFYPYDREAARAELGIPPDKRVLMFAAADVSKPIKGSDLLLTALEQLPMAVRRETALLMVGRGQLDTSRLEGLEVIRPGYVSDESRLARYYSAADVYVHPARAEAFGLVMLESLACGTPVVAFAVGGALDMVRPNETGELAEPENPADLSRGIVALLRDDARREAMRPRCREVAVGEFSRELSIERHLAIYRRLAGSPAPGGDTPATIATS